MTASLTSFPMLATVLVVLVLSTLGPLVRAESSCTTWMCYQVPDTITQYRSVPIVIQSGSDPFNVQVHKIVENPDGTFLHVSVANFSAPGPPPLEVTWNADMPVGTSMHIHFDVGGQPRVTSQTRLVLDANGSAGSAISLTPSDAPTTTFAVVQTTFSSGEALNTAASSSVAAPASSKGLSSAATIGIAVGTVLGVIIVVLLACIAFLLRRRSRRDRERDRRRSAGGGRRRRGSTSSEDDTVEREKRSTGPTNATVVRDLGSGPESHISPFPGPPPPSGFPHSRNVFTVEPSTYYADRTNGPGHRRQDTAPSEIDSVYSSPQSGGFSGTQSPGNSASDREFDAMAGAYLRRIFASGSAASDSMPTVPETQAEGPHSPSRPLPEEPEGAPSPAPATATTTSPKTATGGGFHVANPSDEPTTPSSPTAPVPAGLGQGAGGSSGSLAHDPLGRRPTHPPSYDASAAR